MSDGATVRHHGRSTGSSAWSIDVRAAVMLFLVVWASYLATATYTSVQINDNRATAVSAWSVSTRGTFAMPAEWQEEWVDWAQVGADGRVYTDRFPGAVLVGAPFYAVADLFGLAPQPEHPMFLNYAPAGVAAATVAALAVTVLFLVFRRLAEPRLALVAAGIFAFGTPSWSVSADALWTHGLTSLALAAGMLALAAGRDVLAGSAAAVSILARPQTAVVPLVWGVWRGLSRRRVSPILAIGLTSSVGVLALSLYSRALFGTWLPIAGYSDAKVASVVTSSAWAFLEGIGMTLGHPRRGLLLYVPLVLVLLPFVRHGWRESPEWVRSSAIAGVVYLAVQLRSNTWHGGAHYFGTRLTIESLVLAAPLLLRTWQAVAARDRIFRVLVISAAVISVALHLLGATVWTVWRHGMSDWQDRVDSACEATPHAEDCQPLETGDR